MTRSDDRSEFVPKKPEERTNSTIGGTDPTNQDNTTQIYTANLRGPPISLPEQAHTHADIVDTFPAASRGRPICPPVAASSRVTLAAPPELLSAAASSPAAE